MNGAWVLVCGPSGSGKDSVIAAAQRLIGNGSRIVFARRLVTRDVQPGSDHDAVTDAQFDQLAASGGLRWQWTAHGFSYGIAHSYENDVNAGRIVVVNGSRAHVAGLQPSAGIHVVQVTAALDQLAQRLVQRGRDSSEAVVQRLARNQLFSSLQADCVVVNDADLATAGERLASYLLSLR